jgi:hypothetical protein
MRISSQDSPQVGAGHQKFDPVRNRVSECQPQYTRDLKSVRQQHGGLPLAYGGEIRLELMACEDLCVGEHRTHARNHGYCGCHSVVSAENARKLLANETSQKFASEIPDGQMS